MLLEGNRRTEEIKVSHLVLEYPGHDKVIYMGMVVPGPNDVTLLSEGLR